MKPESLLFAKTHEWVAVANEGGQKTATVGLTAFAV
jgi:glycine cleavage system H lipoate-binding protein